MYEIKFQKSSIYTNEKNVYAQVIKCELFLFALA